MKIYRYSRDEPLTLDELLTFLGDHLNEVTNHDVPLKQAYETDYPIFHQTPKPEYKPDVRLAVNFARYITDTFNGYFIGVPIKVTADDEEIDRFVNYLDAYNDQDDNNAELSKIMSIYGHGYEMYFVDDKGLINITYLSPEEAFMIYDDTVLEEPLYFVRVYKDYDGNQYMSVADKTYVTYYSQLNGWHQTGQRIHGFKDVPATEFIENAERQGLYEPVLSLINEYNSALSEKANDVAYFSDAYMKILGAKLSEEDLAQIRDNRIINMAGEGVSDLVVEFMGKPNADTTQENLLDRLERLIYQISQVANISDEQFGASSGIALRYKLLAMSNLAKEKQRKFTSGMNRRYKVIFSNPVSQMNADAWVGLTYTFTENVPANLSEEADIAGKLAGIVSRETQLSVLSIVDDAKAEIERINEDDEELLDDGYPSNRNPFEENEALNGDISGEEATEVE